MAHVLVRHKVADFSNWKETFDGSASFRKMGGSKGGVVFRNANDPAEVFVLLEWESMDKARQFMTNDALPKIMERAGVVDRPDAYFVDEVFRPAL